MHGFTDHEQLDGVQLIHMGGRMYDYSLGRFLSVDPLVDAQLNSQSLNAYSYVLNNPLAGLDPSGYSCRPMTGTNICGTVTSASNGESVETKTVTDPNSGQKVTYTRTVTAGGTTVMAQIGNSGDGTKGMSTAATLAQTAPAPAPARPISKALTHRAKKI